MQRTQIYIPDELRMEIDTLRKEARKSLSEYTRVALEDRVKKDKKKKVDLKILADAFIGSSTKTDAEIQKWLDWVRDERRLSDEVREKRLQKALKKK